MPDTIHRESARYDPIETENYHLHHPSVDGNPKTGVSAARGMFHLMPASVKYQCLL